MNSLHHHSSHITITQQPNIHSHIQETETCTPSNLLIMIICKSAMVVKSQAKALALLRDQLHSLKTKTPGNQVPPKRARKELS